MFAFINDIRPTDTQTDMHQSTNMQLFLCNNMSAVTLLSFCPIYSDHPTLQPAMHSPNLPGGMKLRRRFIMR